MLVVLACSFFAELPVNQATITLLLAYIQHSDYNEWFHLTDP